MATKSQTQQIKTLVRRANRRIERAQEKAPGQARALLYYATGKAGNKFSAATANMSERQAQSYIEKLERFLEAKSTTRKGWDAVKRKNVKKANETLTDMGYDLTDEELADILIQLESKKGIDYYYAINLVQASKLEAGKEWKGGEDAISKAISEEARNKWSAQQALEKALGVRKAQQAELSKVWNKK